MYLLIPSKKLMRPPQRNTRISTCPCKNVDDLMTKLCKEKIQFENAVCFIVRQEREKFCRNNFRSIFLFSTCKSQCWEHFSKNSIHFSTVTKTKYWRFWNILEIRFWNRQFRKCWSGTNNRQFLESTRWYLFTHITEFLYVCFGNFVKSSIFQSSLILEFLTFFQTLGINQREFCGDC